MSALDQIQDFLEITPDLLTAGQPLEDQIPLIKEAGCEVVINLASHASPDYVATEADTVRGLGMAYIHIPVEWSAPKAEDLQVYFAALEANRGRRIFVHCARNMRVSAFTYLYRVLVLGLDPDACMADLNKIWQPNVTWGAFITARLEEAKFGC